MATTVFWDWNGTLCNDVQPALDAVNEMLRRRGKEEIGLYLFRSCIDTPIEKFYAHFFDFSVDPMEKISPEYHALYKAYLPLDCLAPGAKETLQLFSEKGIRQVVLSSSHKDTILPYLESNGILHYFDAVLAADNWLALPKHERAKKYCEEKGIDGKDAWFVGDLLHDRETAEYCGGHCLLLPTGHHNADTLMQAGDCFCPSFSEIKHRILG